MDELELSKGVKKCLEHKNKIILYGWPLPETLKQYKLKYPNISFRRKQYNCYNCYQANKNDYGIRKDEPRCASPVKTQLLVLKLKTK